MIPWCLLIIFIEAVLRINAEISCFSGQQSEKIVTEPLEQDKMCSISIETVDGNARFTQRRCQSTGCHDIHYQSPYCCCLTNECNTISFYELNSHATYSIQYIGHFLILIIFIAKLLLLLIIFYGNRLKPFDKNPNFEKRIHLDFTQFIIRPKLSPNEINEIIERITNEDKDPPNVFSPSLKIRAVLTYSTNDRITYRETSKQRALSKINSTSRMEEILFELIRIGPCEIDWSSDVVYAILSEAYEIFQAEPTLIELSVPIAIYGDLHGQYSDLWRWFRVNGWPPETRCLFLGDYVDRGRHSTEVLMFVLLLKIVMPKVVFVCRGNHEDPAVNKKYNFYSEIKTRFPKKFKKLFAKIGDVYSVMPIACLISDQILCMHGGLSPRIQLVSEIAALQKPLCTTRKDDRHVDILWSDPKFDAWIFEPNIYRDPAGVGVGYLFGPIQIRNFIKRNKLSLIVRGHQPPMSGYERVGKYLLTIFSTPGYRVEQNVGNMGASLLIDDDGTMDIIRIQNAEQLNLKRQRYKMDKGVSYKDCGKPKRTKVRASEDEKYS